MSFLVPKTQTAALVRKLGGDVEFVHDYPVSDPGKDEVLVQMLYTGVCQSDLHTAAGTAPGADGQPITAVKLPHVGGHEGVGRIVKLGPVSGNRASLFTPASPRADIGALVGVRFLSRVCGECEFCSSGREQHCGKATNHLHHEDGSFQEYCVLDWKYLTVLPPDVDPVVVGPTLCAGVTAYKAVLNANLEKDQYLCVIGAGGGLGHFALQYGLALGARVIGIDTGKVKGDFITSLGAQFVDFRETKDLVSVVAALTDGGAHAAVVASGHGSAFTTAVDILRINGVLCCIGIPPADVHLTTPIATIVIKGLRVCGNLVGSMKDTLEAVELVRQGKVKPRVEVRPFRELPRIYGLLERGDVLGRVVLKVNGSAGSAKL